MHFKRLCSPNGWVNEEAAALWTAVIQNQVKVNFHVLQSVNKFVNGAIVQAMS